MRIFRMMRAVRAARAVAKLSANMDIFDAAAAGNLAMIAKKVSSAKKDDDEEELDAGTVQRPFLPSIRRRRRTPSRRVAAMAYVAPDAVDATPPRRRPRL